MKRIIASDFDGTITTRDTLVEFIRFAKGNWHCLFGFLLYSPLMVLMKFKLYPNYKSKQKLFSHFFKGMPIDEFNRLGRDFAASSQHLIRPGARAMIEQGRRDGAEVVIVSASIDNWVQPFFPDLMVLGTQIETANGVVTGRFASKNCHGSEKVRRLLELYPDRQHYHLTAYGDSSGDKELLDFADEKYYKPFRQ